MREGSDRAQTEPLASLVAIAVLALALGLYGMYLTDSLPGASDRSVEGPTLDRVWRAIASDGVFDPAAVSGSEWTAGDAPVGLASVIDPPVLPQGRSVYIAVTVIDQSRGTTTVAREQFAPDGSATTIDRPEGVDRKTRAVPVRTVPGSVIGGKLVVEVWR